MPRYDFFCEQCGEVFECFKTAELGATATCSTCEREAQRVWMGKQHATAFHKTETTVVWRNPQTGKIEYPGRNDIPVPPRLAAMGFERHELRSLKEVERFEKHNGVRNERAWFDKGSGKSFDRDGAL